MVHALPARNTIAKVEHHAALPFADVPDFMAQLAFREGIAARATNRPFVRCVTLQASVKSSVSRPHNPAGGNGRLQKWHQPSRAVCMPISATKSANTRHKDNVAP